MAKYKVNKEKCIGCGLCITECPDGTELKDDGKAEIVDSQKLEECGGKKVCPYGDIEIEKDEE